MTTRMKGIGAAALGAVLNVFVVLVVIGVLSGDRVTALPFTPYSDGQACMMPGECASQFCEQGVCCNQSCNGPLQSCNDPGFVGTCVTRQGAPALSWHLQLVVLGLLVLLAWRRLAQRTKHGA